MSCLHHPRIRTAAAVLTLSLLATSGWAQSTPPSANASKKPGQAVQAADPWVQVDSAWIRPMVKGQTATGGFMVLTARQPLTLEAFAMARTGVPELHEMTMDGQVMRMRAISNLALPAGQAVVLRPGGHHLMLTQLQDPLTEGEVLQLTLKLRTADGKVVTQAISVPVKAHMMMPSGGASGTTPSGMAAQPAAHQHHHGMAH